jgi:hypothetical protein
MIRVTLGILTIIELILDEPEDKGTLDGMLAAKGASGRSFIPCRQQILLKMGSAFVQKH